MIRVGTSVECFPRAVVTDWQKTCLGTLVSGFVRAVGLAYLNNSNRESAGIMLIQWQEKPEMW